MIYLKPLRMHLTWFFYIKKMHFDLNNKEGRGGLAATKASNSKRRFKKNSEFNIQEG